MSDMTEAPFSTNWKMYYGGEAFQFTVRATDLEKFVTALTVTMSRLKAEGYQTIGEMAEAGTLPAVATVAAQHAAQATVPNGKVGASPEMKMEEIEGYVVGSYMDRDNTKKIRVYLYTPRLTFPVHQYTVYPERANLLPFAFPTDSEWDGPAPKKDEAIARKVFHRVPFNLLVVPERNPDGSMKTNPKGYQIYRLPNKDEAPIKNTAAPAAVKMKPSGGADSANTLLWSMMDHAAAVASLGIPDPLDGWLIDVRDHLMGPIATKDENDEPVKTATKTHFDLLNNWVYNKVLNSQWAVDSMVTVRDAGEVPLAGFVMGVLTDNFTANPAALPYEATAAVLQNVMTMRGTDTNPLYSPMFEENLIAVLQAALPYVSVANPSDF